MIDHLSVGVSDMVRARRFYDPVLKALGYRRHYDAGDLASAYGAEERQLQFWVCRPRDDARPASAGNGSHVCFRAQSRAAVDGFHAEALRCEGRDAGAPGLRPQYTETYYGAFVFDPDDNKLGAVCHSPE